MNFLNLIKIVEPFSKKLPISFRAVIWKVPIFGARVFIFAGHRPLMGKLLHTECEYNPSNHWGASVVCIYLHADERNSNKTFCHIHVDSKPVNPSKSQHQFYMNTTHHMYHIHKKIMDQVRLYRARWPIGNALHLYSGDRFESRPHHRLFWSLSWFLSVSPDKYWDITLIRPRSLPFRSLPIHNSFINLPLEAVQSSYWQWHHLTHKIEANK
jgi:hypothetical protein